MKILKLMAFAAAISVPSLAHAHSFWLEPEHYRLEQGDDIDVAFRVGDNTDIEAWNLRWDKVVSLIDHYEGGFADRQADIAVKTDDMPGGAKIRFAVPGRHILAFASQPSFIELEAGKFNPYAEEEGLTPVLELREKTGTTQDNSTELYSRRAKLLIQVGGETTDNILQPIGQTLEIVPERNPYSMGNDRTLPVRIMFRGKPLAGGLVELIDLTDPAEPVARQKSDAEGRTTFEIPQRGAWRINLIWSVPNPGNDRAQFDTVFSSLTFGYDGIPN